MNFRDKLREHGLGWILRDFWYRMDWRKPDKQSVKLLLQREYEFFWKFAHILPNYKNRSRDKRMIAVLRWVIDNIVYTSDMMKFNVVEKWEDVSNVLETKQADCESGALLIFAWARYLGISSADIKLVCGKVTEGGHAWIEYKADYDNEWYKIDWCFYPDDSYIEDRKNNDSKYLEKWFEVTDY